MHKLFLFLLPLLTLTFSACLDDNEHDYPDTKLIKGQWQPVEEGNNNARQLIYRFTTDSENTWSWGGLVTYIPGDDGTVSFQKRYTWHVSNPANEQDGRPRLELTWYDAPESGNLWDATEYYIVVKLTANEMWLKRAQKGLPEDIRKFVRRNDLPVPPAWPDETEQPDKPAALPEEAMFKFKPVQLKTFMDLDTPVPAPFDCIAFQMLDHKGEFAFPELSGFVAYYDSIVVSSPNMPDTHKLYWKEINGSRTVEQFTSQWASFFFEKNDFPIVIKGYKDGTAIYETSRTQVMRERDFLGIDWKHGNVALANPKTQCVYCVLDKRFEFLLTDTQLRNNRPFVKIEVASADNLSDADNLKREKEGLTRLLEKFLKPEQSLTALDFTTLPDEAELVKCYGNNTTRAALLHFKGNEARGEHFFIIAEEK